MPPAWFISTLPETSRLLQVPHIPLVQELGSRSGVDDLKSLSSLIEPKIEVLGPDTLIEGYVHRPH